MFFEVFKEAQTGFEPVDTGVADRTIRLGKHAIFQGFPAILKIAIHLMTTLFSCHHCF